MSIKENDQIAFSLSQEEAYLLREALTLLQVKKSKLCREYRDKGYSTAASEKNKEFKKAKELGAKLLTVQNTIR